MSPKALQRVVGVPIPIRSGRLGNRRQEAHQGLRRASRSAGSWAWAATRRAGCRLCIAEWRLPSVSALTESSIRRTSGVDEIGSARLSGPWGRSANATAGARRIAQRVLQERSDGDALQPTPRRAEFIMVNMALGRPAADRPQPALGAVEVHHAVPSSLMPILCSIEPQRTALRSPTLPSRPTLNFAPRTARCLRARGRVGELGSTRWMMLSVSRARGG